MDNKNNKVNIHEWVRTISAIFLLCACVLTFLGIQSYRDLFPNAVANNTPNEAFLSTTTSLSNKDIPNFTPTHSLVTATVLPYLTPTSIPESTTTIISTDVQGQVVPIVWQLNPTLPQPQGFIGWISTEPSQDFVSGIWTQGVNISIDANQLLLIFGGLLRLPTIGEVGTRTSCFVLTSRGPLNLSLDLMSARLEIHNVNETATALEWGAQKALVMQESYPSTCGEGLDIIIGK